MVTDGPDRLATRAREHEDGWRLGFVEGAMFALSKAPDASLAELVRRFGRQLVERCAASRPGIEVPPDAATRPAEPPAQDAGHPREPAARSPRAPRNTPRTNQAR